MQEFLEFTLHVPHLFYTHIYQLIGTVLFYQVYMYAYRYTHDIYTLNKSPRLIG